MVEQGGWASKQLQTFIDDLTLLLNGQSTPLQLPKFTVANLPTNANEAGFIYVSDESGGAVPAFYDGTNWRRVTDRAIVS